jgi:AraC family transcriptional regulator, regulatory protein of adaptative response / DNA-3-methyladenine glycosylase II
VILERDTCYRALKAHDPRFDGCFFVGVSSTGIYCRPVCTVRVPRFENCTFYPSAAAAEAEHYRPCLRCRPELAPGNASIDASRRIALAAAGFLETRCSIEAIAQSLQVTSRHLRRVFHIEFGVTPVAFAQTHRLLLAKRLLTDTALPVTDVAYAAGFGSLRRLETVFRTRYRLSPNQLRKGSRHQSSADSLSFELGFRPPYNWDAMLSFLRPRCIAGVEAVEEASYRRTVRIPYRGDRYTGWIDVKPHRRKSTMVTTVSASLSKVIPVVLSRVKHLLDLSCNPAQVEEVLGPLAASGPGLRVPGAFDSLETATQVLLGKAATANLVLRYGLPVNTPYSSLTTLFPDAGHLPLRSLPDTIGKFEAMRGIDRRTAQYMAMRTLAWPDAWPSEDPAAGDGWKPWRAYAAMHKGIKYELRD